MLLCWLHDPKSQRCEVRRYPGSPVSLSQHIYCAIVKSTQNSLTASQPYWSHERLGMIFMALTKTPRIVWYPLCWALAHLPRPCSTQGSQLSLSTFRHLQWICQIPTTFISPIQKFTIASRANCYKSAGNWISHSWTVAVASEVFRRLDNT